MVSRILFAVCLHAALGGCVGAATSVVKAPFTAVSLARVPFKVGGKVVDWTTTSQAEADRNAGRRMRRAEQREGRERRDWAKRCRGQEANAACQDYRGFRAAG